MVLTSHVTVTEAGAGVSIAAAGGQSHVSPPPPLRPAAGLPGARPHTLPAGTQVACGREQLFQISVVKMLRGEGSWCVTGVFRYHPVDAATAKRVYEETAGEGDYDYEYYYDYEEEYYEADSPNKDAIITQESAPR